MTVAHAATATYAEVLTTDTSNISKITFNLGETVCLHWLADGIVNISVTKGGVPDPGCQLTNVGGIANSEYIYDFTPSLGTGIYEITVTSAQSITIAVGTLDVVPDAPIGAITAIVAIFAAFGVFAWKKRGMPTN